MAKLFGRFILLALTVGLAIGTASAADVESGMVGYWPMDGDARDHSGNGYDGEVIGSPEWVNGRVGQAVKVAGAVGDETQHVYIPGLSLTSNTVTWVTWLNGWKNDTWTGIMMSRGTNSTGIGFGDNDALHYTWSADSTWEWHAGPTIPQDTWAMVAVSLEPTIATAYLYTDSDGLQSITNAADHPEETIDQLRIGWDECCGGARWFIGTIDEAILYERALSADDILEIALNGLAAAVDANGKLTTTWGKVRNQ